MTKVKPDKRTPVILGLGSNLQGPGGRSPLENLQAALGELAVSGCRIIAVSPWYESAPVPPSDQPWFVNGVASIETDLPPDELLDMLHKIEAGFGRVRRRRLEARILDLDILDYGGLVLPDRDRWRKTDGGEGQGRLFLPHPRMHQRVFVLRPLADILADILPEWRHPVLDRNVSELLAALTDAGEVRRLS